MLPCFAIQLRHWGALEKVCKCNDSLYHTIMFLCGATDLTLCIWGGCCCFLPVISYITAFKNNLSYASIFILVSFCPYFFLSILKWDQMLFCFSSRLSIEWRILLHLEDTLSSDSFCLSTSPGNTDIYKVKNGFLPTFLTVTSWSLCSRHQHPA